MKIADGKYEPALIANLNNRDPDHDELRADVQRLLKLPPIPAKGISRAEYWLRVVLRKIEGFQFSHARRTIVPLSQYNKARWQPGVKQNYLRVGREWFVVRDVPDITGGTAAERKRQTIYWVLDQALKSGEFSKVQRCRNPRCLKFFMSNRRKPGSCSKKCNQEFYNRKYQDKGDFMKQYYERKNLAIKRAMNLRDQKKDIEFIMASTGLTKLALIRGKVFDEYAI
jgi:hypothetical protein